MTNPTELETLKARAKQMGIPFSANIGLDTLRAKVNATLNDEPLPIEEDIEINTIMVDFTFIT